MRGTDGRRTIIKIAQRLGTVTDADEIIVMDGGEIVERGIHDDLLERGGLYVQLIKDELGEAAVSGARQAVRRLSKLAPFSSLPPEVLEETARLLLYAERAPGEILCRQGSVGDELFIIGRGEVEIVVTDDEGNERIVNILGEGDYVGEISFLRRVPRTATVRAQTNVEVHILRRLDFDALLERWAETSRPTLKTRPRPASRTPVRSWRRSRERPASRAVAGLREANGGPPGPLGVTDWEYQDGSRRLHPVERPAGASIFQGRVATRTPCRFRLPS